MALAHEIVVSLVFPITEILAIEDNELHDTFIHVTFESQSRLRTMSYLTRSDTNWRIEEGTRGGGGWMGAK
jgi:hypothetical protein